MRLTVLLLLLGTSSALAQGGTEIYLVELHHAAGQVTVGDPVNITNRKGYDNQPAFSRDGKSLFYTVIDSSGQADIFRYDVASRATSRVTNTPESEYSPTSLRDGGISVIRVERDSTQRLWKFRNGDATLLLPNVKPVGYHAWLDDQWLALFVLGNPNTLRIAKVGNDTAVIAAYSIGRALQRLPGTRDISFVQRGADSVMHMRVFRAATGKIDDWGVLPDGGEYHLHLNSGSILATAGTRLYQRAGAEWREVAEFKTLGPISRIALSADERLLAIVVAEPPH
jgi:hypothetical protein